MSQQHDAIVVGARCAGSPTAMLLARKGYRVLVVDRSTFPSDTLSTHVTVMTSNGAKILGLDGDLGTVVGGKRADLVLIEGDLVARPAEIRNVRLVFKDGIGYDSGILIRAVAGQVGVR